MNHLCLNILCLIIKKFPVRRFVDYFYGVQGAFEDTFGTVPKMFFVPNLFPTYKGTVYQKKCVDDGAVL